MKWVWGIVFIFFAVQANAKLRVGLVLDRGGKNDNSFNSAGYQGAIRARDELGVELKYVEAPDVLAFESLQRALAKKNYDLIIAIGFSQTDGLARVAKQFPQLHFAIIDGIVELPNVRSILFEEHEGSFLMGALAARMSVTHKIGFIGGMDIPLIRRFELGYQAGAREQGTPTQILSQYIGITAEAWNNPSKAKEIALSQYSKGADIIYVVAGASGIGAFDAAEDTHHLAIGVDSNQNWIKPGFILTSMMKRVDNAVFDSIRDLRDGKFTSGILHLGLKSGGIDFAVDDNNRKLISPESLQYLATLKDKIMAGTLVVPDYYKKAAPK